MNTILTELTAEGGLPEGLDFSRVTIEPPRDPSHGDLSTNAAMVLSKPAGMKPRDLADQLAKRLESEKGVTEVSVAGPGFINLRLSNDVWFEGIGDVLKAGADFGASDMGTGQAVNVEYVSANPTGPMHVGHVRGAVFGDALANLLEKVGYKVCREYYINDAGGQIEVLSRSAYLRYREAMGETITIPDGLYPGDYLIPVGKALARMHGNTLLDKPDAEWLPLVRETTMSMMMDLIREDLALLGITHETFFSERTLHQSGAVDDVLKLLDEKGLIYTGVLERPKGDAADDWEERPQTLFRSTQFGDDQDRALKKSDGSWTYFAPDIAYHFDKFNRGYTTLIDVWGADHSGYIKRVKAAVAAITDSKAEIDVKVCQMVRLFRNGEPFRMSKRAGDFITLREVVEEVGKDDYQTLLKELPKDVIPGYDNLAVEFDLATGDMRIT